MRVLRCLLLLGVFTGAILYPISTTAQLWSGILESTHGTDWTRAGAQNTHSTGWTQCGSTIAAYSGSASTINTAVTNCGTNQYVLLGPGTFTLSSGISIAKSNVALRGSGADQTFIVFTSAGSCNGLGSLICVNGPNVSAGGNPAGTNWTGGLSQGSTQITLASAAGITPNQSMLIMDQCDDGTTGVPCSGTVKDNGGFYVCSSTYSSGTGCANEASSNAFRTLRSQVQITYATAVSGNVVTIADPVVAPQWRSGQSPQVWLYTPRLHVGLEDMSVDGSGVNSGGASILMYGCMFCWTTGVRIVNPGKYAIRLFEVAHTDVQNNYSYGAQNSDPYCISPDYTSFLKIENNIIQRCRSSIVYEGPDVGTVVAYNYTLDNWDGGTNYMWFSLWTHSSTSMYNLYEGNIGNGMVLDDIHGSHQMNTFFRNYERGWEPGKTSQTNAMYSAAYARYTHFIGNTLGRKGYHNTYQSSTARDATIFILGAGNNNDSVTMNSSMRWGNYDTVNNAVRWQSSEVPSGDAHYPNSVPGTQNLPASFYLVSRPSWWGTEPYPAIGPDVNGIVYGSNGTSWVTEDVNGFANDIPAMDCYKNVMRGPADGSGSALTFNADACYNGGVSSTPPPAAPTGLSATVN